MNFKKIIGKLFTSKFNIHEFNIHGTVHRSMTSSNNQRDAA